MGKKRRKAENEVEIEKVAPILKSPYDDAFSYFTHVVRGKIKPNGALGSLEVNMAAMEILDAAVRSAKKGKTINLKP